MYMHLCTLLYELKNIETIQKAVKQIIKLWKTSNNIL